MNRAIRLQGTLFLWIALATILGSLALPALDPKTELGMIAALILLLGVPHGALDTIFAQQVYHLHSLRGWAAAGLVYAALGALVVGLWIVSPLLFLSGFLILSCAHFSGDPTKGTAMTSRLAYGGAMIILPALRHSDEVKSLFGFLAGPEAAAILTPWLAALALPWLIAVFLAALWELRRDRQTGLELIAVGLIAILASPLIGFAVFFCAMHSARHILRTVDYGSHLAPRLVLAAGLAPMAFVVAASLVCWIALGNTPFEPRVIQIVFVGLAALTVPHMALVERVRLSGWALGRQTRMVAVIEGEMR